MGLANNAVADGGFSENMSTSGYFAQMRPMIAKMNAVDKKKAMDMEIAIMKMEMNHQMAMTPEEAINAATINTAYTLGLAATHGTITIGKIANVFITTPLSSLAALPYNFGSNPVSQVILNGKLIAL